MRISFHGAAQNVTGSCHLLDTGSSKILVDCGLYQGGRELREENAEDFGFDPRSIDYVLLTHAHLDHCGRIPLLYRRGFRGKIVTTSATRELTKVVLMDSAHLHEEEAARRARYRRRTGDGEAEPLYTVLDALNSLDLFSRTTEYGEALKLDADTVVTFVDAGHILGSACIHVASGGARVLFSGDLGNRGRPILRNPAPPPAAENVVMETTYGDRRHRTVEESVDEFYTAVLDTVMRGGKVLIPTFALERSQEILYYLREGMENGRLPRTVPVFLDSPMAISATEVFRRHPECYDREAAELFESGVDPFAPPRLELTHSAEASMAINKQAGPAIIMAGSGMCTGGRIRHHLKHNLWRSETSVIFVGFAAPRTLARRLVDGAEKVRIFDEELKVNAQIHTINGFSAHADERELRAWHGRIPNLARTFLVHGDPERGMNSMFDSLVDAGHEVFMPEPGERHDLLPCP